MSDPEHIDPALEEARASFRAFYSVATQEDTDWMDALYLSWIAFVQNVSLPRRVLPPAMREEVERTGDKIEAAFMKARDRVRECPTFKKLVPGDQKRIEAVLFQSVFADGVTAKPWTAQMFL